MNKQEEFKTRALAKLLTEHGVAADFEQKRGRKAQWVKGAAVRILPKNATRFTFFLIFS